MARRQSIGIRRTLTSLLPSHELDQIGFACGAIQRRRKVSMSAMVWTLVLGFGTGRIRNLAGLRRTYKRVTGEALVPSSFYDRFTPALTRMLREVLDRLLVKLAEQQTSYGGTLAGFRDVLAADTTVVKLHRLLADRYPGTRTNSSPAAAKLHLVMSVRGSGTTRVKLTDERAHDGRTLRLGRWVQGRLLLLDLGFFRYQLFDCIDRNGGFFISRLASNANPTIVAVHRRWRGRSVELVGQKLHDVARRLKRTELDVEVDVRFQRRSYRGVRRTVTRRLRLVGVRLPESSDYRFYITNVDAERLDARDVAQTYAARWQVELVFKELKSHYRLDELPSRKAHVVEALLLAAVITLLLSRRLLDAVRKRLEPEGYSLPEQRWASLVASVAHTIIDIVMLPRRAAGTLARHLEPMLLDEARDPNRNRPSLVERVEGGVVWA